MREGSIKNIRISAEVRKEIQNVVVNGIKDLRTSAMATMTDARVTTDLYYCTAYVSVLDNEQEAADMLAGLKSIADFIHSELTHSVDPRTASELKLILDEPMAYGTHIDKVLEDLHLSEQVETEES